MMRFGRAAFETPTPTQTQPVPDPFGGMQGDGMGLHQ